MESNQKSRVRHYRIPAKFSTKKQNCLNLFSVIEEAAQVLEAHVVTALSKNTDHLILIGDHKQLRPRNEVDELARKFKLNISLFERLILNKMEYHQLAEQRRMRPEIASLVLPHIYDERLLNHADVGKYENVKGKSNCSCLYG